MTLAQNSPLVRGAHVQRGGVPRTATLPAPLASPVRTRRTPNTLRFNYAPIQTYGMDSDKRLIRRPEILHESYAPSAIQERDAQAKELAWCLSPLLKREHGMNAWLHGPAGSGKTAVVQHVLQSLDAKSSVPSTYVNCWERFTFHGVLDRILIDLRVLAVEGRSTAFKLERLERHISGKPFIIVLDDPDRAPPLERNDILYNLMGANNTCLVCVASGVKGLTLLDSRVRSRFNPVLIEFPSYTPAELAKLLAFRAEHALADRSYDAATLAAIAERSDGDARVAIQVLRNAARLAAREQSQRIEMKHVEAAWSTVRDLKKLQALASLTSHHRLLHEIVKAKGEVSSGDLWNLYLEGSKEQGQQPIASRTFNDYTNTLVRLGLATAEWSIMKEKGRTRLFRPTDRGLE